LSYSLHPEAEKELADTADFYRAQGGVAVGNAFLSDFTRLAGLLERNPTMGRPVRNGLRIHPLRRFPYSLVYRARSEGILILVVGHQHRRPDYWRRRS
jgi:plasmid stabilization system protein ParE